MNLKRYAVALILAFILAAAPVVAFVPFYNPCNSSQPGWSGIVCESACYMRLPKSWFGC